MNRRQAWGIINLVFALFLLIDIEFTLLIEGPEADIRAYTIGFGLLFIGGTWHLVKNSKGDLF